MAGETVVGRGVADPGAAVPQPGTDDVAPGGGGAGGGVVAVVCGFRESLSAVDVTGLSDRERVDLVAELERVKGAVSAVQARATDAYRVSREVLAPRDVARSVGSEVALARRESPSMGDRFVGLSRALVHEMPYTMAALEQGECGERHAVAVVAATACLSVADRVEVDRRVGPLLGRLGVKGATGAAARVAGELDAASVVARMEAAVRSRRVGVRPAPDGMAYLTVLGPLKDVVGAHAALKTRARAVVGGQCPDEAPDGRGVGAVATDTALAALSGRAVGQLQPVEVHLVMTDRALLGLGDPARSVYEPARIPGHGSVPAPVARAWLRQGLDEPAGPPDGPPRPKDGLAGAGATGLDVAGDRAARVWVRRVFTSPEGRDLVAMESRRRVFSGLLRRMLVLRDDVCTTPWCESPVVHADHAIPVRQGGATTYRIGNGRCERCNYGKEALGWLVRVIRSGLAPTVSPDPDPHPHADPDRHQDPHPRCAATAEHEGEDLGPHEIEVTTPTGRTYRAQAPPLTGWGWEPTAPPGRRRKRPRLVSRLERHLIDQLATA